MKENYQERLKAALDEIKAFLPKKAKGGLCDFTGYFYTKVPLGELEKMNFKRSAAAATDAWKFMQERDPGKPKIRIFSPSMEENGYDGRHVIIELINDDKPFLVDSLTAALMRLGFTIHETTHPIFETVRGKKGELKDIRPQDEGGKETHRESFIHFEVSPLPSDLSADTLEHQLERVLAFVRSAVADWPEMLDKAKEIEDELRQNAASHHEEEIEEAVAFVSWLRNRNFVFLGYSDRVEKLGVSALEDPAPSVTDSDQLVSVTKSDHPSLVHRSVLMDVVNIKKSNGDGIYQFVGLFTSSVYYQMAEAVPVLRQKLQYVINRAGFEPSSHDGKALKTILEFLPRDEMFQYDKETLFDVALGLLSLEDRPGIRLFARRDPYERFVSCMVFVPREHFSTELRITIIRRLTQAYQGTLETFYTQMTESALARLHIIVRTTPGFIPDVNVEEIEADVARSTLLWSDELRRELVKRYGEGEAERHMRTFANAFPASYISRYDIKSTVFDVEKCLEALAHGKLTVDLFAKKAESNTLYLKIYSPSEEIALSDIIPMLENMGFRAIEEHPFLICPHGEGKCDIWIRDFKLQLADEQELALEYVKPLLEEALLRVWNKEMSNDGFNALVLRANLTWRQVVVVRAYTKYLKQMGFAYTQGSIVHAMKRYPEMAKTLVALFMARFDPEASDHEAKHTYLLAQIETLLGEIDSITDDRIMRQFMHLIQATLRTNFFQTDNDGQHKSVLSFKFRSEKIPGLPKPVPFAEIFVYSTRVEGIHLRGGKVARGGLRWSDRHEDFRTEVLGLMKAQMVKNSVIVPVGSKGGFVVKNPPAGGSREEIQSEGIACYRLYLSGLLDITDNLISGKVVTPANLIRYDGEDPYLVVAADKGTATFSDIANEMSQSYNFWLDDAFASGGSAGYDHKKMGITARGAWVSVERHFRELGTNIDHEEFTVVGVGDMGGDVFGNGMLLSDNIRLIAAFNHLHIFLDPNPDAKESFAERQRLFNLPRSTWKDYDTTKISKGGSVYERTSKTITLSREAKAALGVDKDNFNPDELIRAILKAPVDLLWNGGIGTYVKAEEETHDEVGDRANNPVRINGSELSCRVVGEGGNLGFTQRGRIEFARNGGMINTDAIDNSGGVDCSDHEVNIKLTFAHALAENELTRDTRNDLLVDMTEEVAQLVLKDNALQTQAISLASRQGVSLLEPQARFMRRLERDNMLDRTIEFLPTDDQLVEMRMAGKALSRPELAVVLAYAKIALYSEILESTLPDEPYFAIDLARYFPQLMQKDFMDEVNKHPLRREIISTVATNSLINRVGITFFFDMQEDMAKPTREVAAAYTFARDAFEMRKLWAEIERAKDTVSIDVQMGMMLAASRLIERGTIWALRNLSSPINVEQTISSYQKDIKSYCGMIGQMHSESTKVHYEQEHAALKDANVSDELATSLAQLDMLSSACDIINVSRESSQSMNMVGKVYFELGEILLFGRFRMQALEMPIVSLWDRQALLGLVQDLYSEQQRLTAAVVKEAKQGANAEQALKVWEEKNQDALMRYKRFAEDLLGRGGAAEISAIMVSLKHIRMLG